MKYLYPFMKEHYPEETKWLEETYPNMIETAKQVEMVDWQDEWAIADHNPEYIDQYKLLEMALDSGMISEEEFKKEVNRIRPPYASKTLAVAFRKERKVAFREFPTISTVMHELGHIHFNADEIEWNTAYGGGENLIHLTYSRKGHFTEEDIRNYMDLYRKIYLSPPEAVSEIAWLIGKKIIENLEEEGFTDLPSHPISLALMAGTLPSVEVTTEEGQILLWNTDSRELDKYIYSGKIEFKPISFKSALLIFISVYLQDGFIHNDPFYLHYAKAFFKKLKEILNEVKLVLNKYDLFFIQDFLIPEIEKYCSLNHIVHPPLRAEEVLRKLKQVNTAHLIDRLKEIEFVLIPRLKESNPEDFNTTDKFIEIDEEKNEIIENITKLIIEG